MFPLVTFDQITRAEANELLVRWQHRMGPINRPMDGVDLSYAVILEGKPVAVTVASSLIRECVAGAPHLDRTNSVELSRLCADRPGLCRVALRLWRLFVFPRLGVRYAVSYQDADLHSGATYRFDGWKRIARSRSGVDQRSGRVGRDKWVWIWELETAKATT